MEVIDEFDGIEFDRELYDVPPPEAYGLPRTPFVEYRKPSVVEKGTFYKPILREITRGQIDNSRIYHTREGNEHNFEYRRYNVYKKGFTAQCIYSRRPDVKCPATKDLTALNPVAIYRTQVPGKRAKFEINRNIPLSTADWSVTENISRKSHTEFCKRQVEYKDRVHNLDILNGNDRFAIIKERAKYPRFQENGPLTREFRFVHTRKAIPSQKYETKTQEREWTFRPNHGPRFYPMIMRMTNELRSSYYHQQKGKDKSAPGEIQVNEVWPSTTVVLCSVHIVRAIMKNFRTKVDSKYFKNPKLNECFQVIKGAIFLNLADPGIFRVLDYYLRITVWCSLNKKLQKKFEIFTNYLFQTFFGENASFSFNLFKYYSAIVHDENYNPSTNCIECINKKLKSDAEGGNLTYERALTIIRDFKEDYLQDFERRVVNNDLNRRRAATTLREQSLGIILNEFHNMEREQQLASVIDYAKKIASIPKIASIEQLYVDDDSDNDSD